MSMICAILGQSEFRLVQLKCSLHPLGINAFNWIEAGKKDLV